MKFRPICKDFGSDFRRIRSRRGVWRANYTPKLKKRTALLRKLKDVFRRYQSQPVDRVVQLINPMLRNGPSALKPSGFGYPSFRLVDPLNTAALIATGTRTLVSAYCYNAGQSPRSCL